MVFKCFPDCVCKCSWQLLTHTIFKFRRNFHSWSCVCLCIYLSVLSFRSNFLVTKPQPRQIYYCLCCLFMSWSVIPAAILYICRFCYCEGRRLDCHPNKTCQSNWNIIVIQYLTSMFQLYFQFLKIHKVLVSKQKNSKFIKSQHFIILKIETKSILQFFLKRTITFKNL